MNSKAPRVGSLLLALCAFVPACVGAPRPEPLDPDALLASVRAEREEPQTAEGAPLTLAEASALLRRANPTIREARATWQIAESVARTKTPIPNPTIALGPLFFGGGNILDMAKVGYQAGLGWAMPVKNPPKLADQVNRVRADAAFARAVAVEREAYLGLRASMASAVLGQEEQLVLARLIDTASAATKAGRAMAASGQGTSVDVRLLELEQAKRSAGAIAVRGRSVRAQREVAGLLGLAPSRVNLEGSPLPALPSEVPSMDAIEAASIAGHPQLDILRAEYLVAEKVLRQECQRANPGMNIGAEFERTQPSNQLGLPLGIELPIFDQNQIALAAARAERNAVRARYRATLQRLLGDIAVARARLRATMEVLAAMDSTVKEATDRAVAAARAGLDAGTVDALRFLATVQAQAEVAVERFQARRDVFEAWAALEVAAGVPLLDWPAATASQDDTEEVK